MSDINEMNVGVRWYVVHTYSGYENKVMTNLVKIVENRGLGHLIFDVKVPVETVVEKKGDEEKEVESKIFPGYVLVKMIMTEESWHVVRNITGVTGFVGPGSKPVPLSDEEVRKMGVDTVRQAEIGLSVGDRISVKSGPMEGFSGIIETVDSETGKISAKINMFDREVSLEIEAAQVTKID